VVGEPRQNHFHWGTNWGLFEKNQKTPTKIHKKRDIHRKATKPPQPLKNNPREPGGGGVNPAERRLIIITRGGGGAPTNVQEEN